MTCPRSASTERNSDYEEQGEGIPLLAVHGTPGSAPTWVDAARELAQHGRCVIYDRRGFHRSASRITLPKLNLADHVGDAAALLIALNSGPAIVIGANTGGLIALELARGTLRRSGVQAAGSADSGAW
jgi:pimeloyl-ACP methyl ester carboxylesterase